MKFKSGSSTTIVQTTRAFGGRGLIESVQNDWTGSSPSPYMASKYEYANDALARRTSCVRTGTAFAAAHHDVWAYNDRNELTGSARHAGTQIGQGDEDADLGRAYAYDPIGNRAYYDKGQEDRLYYCANQLNQYTQTAATSQPCSQQAIDAFAHDEDGNMTLSPLGDTPAPHTLKWDAENRLKAAYPTTPEAGSKKLEYTYDYMNRRVARKVFDWDPELGEGGDWETTPSEHTRYVYHGWNVILELNALSSNAILKKYTWGLDIAGLNGQVNSLDAAGGIGGLLACLDTSGTRSFACCYDANGNVTQLVETTTGGNQGTLQAKYEYDAYGNTIIAGGSYAASNLIRFSTRPIDPLTGLGHWPMRVLDFERGRWGSRDPISEDGGVHLYCYGHNHPLSDLDALGLDQCHVCCCVDDFRANAKTIPYNGARSGDWGHDITFTATLRIKIWKNPTAPCTFEFWEWADVKTDFIKGYKANTWNNLSAFADSPTTNNFRTGLEQAIPVKDPCFRKDVKVSTVDSPSLPIGDAKYANTKRNLYLAVRVKSAPGCPCRIADGTIYVHQYLTLDGTSPGLRPSLTYDLPPKSVGLPPGW